MIHRIVLRSFLFCSLMLMTIVATTAGKAQPHTQTITVFAASSLTEVFSELGKRFEQLHPSVHVASNFGGSQMLLQELLQGADADIFAPANPGTMDKAVAAGLIDSPMVRTLCTNSLIVVVPAQNRARIDSLADLAREKVTIILAQKAVPVGGYALEVLTKCDREFGNNYKERVLRNVVSYEENVKVVVGKVRLGEADAGIVYCSDVATDSLRTLKVLEIPPRLNVAASYPIGALAAKRSNPLVRQFLDFCSGGDAKKIFTRFGFTIPAPVKGSR